MDNVLLLVAVENVNDIALRNGKSQIRIQSTGLRNEGTADGQTRRDWIEKATLADFTDEVQCFEFSCWIEENRAFAGHKFFIRVRPLSIFYGIVRQPKQTGVKFTESCSLRHIWKEGGNRVGWRAERIGDHGKARRKCNGRVTNDVGRSELATKRAIKTKAEFGGVGINVVERFAPRGARGERRPVAQIRGKLNIVTTAICYLNLKLKRAVRKTNRGTQHWRSRDNDFIFLNEVRNKASELRNISSLIHIVLLKAS